MNVIFDTERATLIHGETLATLRRFADKSFDAIITDPPYGEHVHAKLGKERRNDGAEARDELTFPPVDAALIAELAREFVRLSKGWINIFSDFYMSDTWGNAIVAAGGAYVRRGAWVKTSPMPQMTGDRPGCGHEDIVVAHAFPDTLEGRRQWDWNGGGKAALWRGGRDKGVGEDPHPNQKPEWLIQSLIGQFVPAGGTILDPFLGSGTAFAAALRPDRAVGEVALETGCTKCLRAHAEAYKPPLPVDVKVVGIEGDPKWFPTITERTRAVYAF